jgi:hypothetical protein
MNFLLVQCPSPADATAADAEAEAGSLWGVSLGTTSSSVSNGQFLCVEATPNRCASLAQSAPSGWWITAPQSVDWEAIPDDYQAWYLLGTLHGA